jgi:hypothetical protein
METAKALISRGGALPFRSTEQGKCTISGARTRYGASCTSYP